MKCKSNSPLIGIRYNRVFLYNTYKHWLVISSDWIYIVYVLIMHQLFLLQGWHWLMLTKYQKGRTSLPSIHIHSPTRSTCSLLSYINNQTSSFWLLAGISVLYNVCFILTYEIIFKTEACRIFCYNMIQRDRFSWGFVLGLILSWWK